jgi:hypothetical protein
MLTVEEFDQRAAVLHQAAAQVYAATFALALLATEWEKEAGITGYASTAEILNIHAGLDGPAARELVRVGQALEGLPELRERFASGTISYDKVRALTRVMDPALMSKRDEETWLVMAEYLSASQLISVCRAYRRAMEAADPDRDEKQHARRGVTTQWQDDGMLRLIALLPPDEGKAVMGALDAVSGRKPKQEDTTPKVADDPSQLWPAKRADALVEICAHAVATPDLMKDPSSRMLVVHVDVGVLTGQNPDGRCHIEGGPHISAELARRLGCDCEIVTITERDGLPIDVGRATRAISNRLNEARISRDRTCRFPGCNVPARRTEAHHIIPWYLDGPTDLKNLASLCVYHHHRRHDGTFTIEGDPESGLRFIHRNGREIKVLPLDPVALPEYRVGSPWAKAGGERNDIDMSIYGLCNSAASAPRAGPAPHG